MIPTPMTDPNGAAIYGVPWIPSIKKPSHVTVAYIYIYQHHGSYMGHISTDDLCGDFGDSVVPGPQDPQGPQSPEGSRGLRRSGERVESQLRSSCSQLRGKTWENPTATPSRGPTLGPT